MHAVRSIKTKRSQFEHLLAKLRDPYGEVRSSEGTGLSAAMHECQESPYCQSPAPSFASMKELASFPAADAARRTERFRLALWECGNEAGAKPCVVVTETLARSFT